MSAPRIAAAHSGMGTDRRDGPLRILFVVEHVPFVPASGGTTRTFHMVRAACEMGAVTLVSLWGEPSDPRYAEVRRLCSEVRIVAPIFSPTWASGTAAKKRRSLKGTMVALVTRLPAVQRCIRTTVRWALVQVVRRRLQTSRYDLVVVEYTDLAAALSKLVQRTRVPAIANLQNVDSVVYSRSKQFDETAASMTVGHRLKLLRRLERRIVDRYDVVQVCSDVDIELLTGSTWHERLRVVPNGVDIAYFADPGPVASLPEHDGSQPLLVFTGTLAHAPNADALMWFVEQIWPILVRQRPRIHFAIVGAGPVPAHVERYGQLPGISLHVSVPDVRPYLRAATVAIVPIRIGSGTRLKILDAMALRVPVVSTTVGAEGLGLTSGTEILLADESQAFADAIEMLLDDPLLAQRLADAGSAAVQARYDWSAIRDAFTSQARELLVEMRRSS